MKICSNQTNDMNGYPVILTSTVFFLGAYLMKVFEMKINNKMCLFSCRHISFESFEVVFPYDYNFAECFEEVLALPDISCIYHTESYIDIYRHISCVIKALISVFVF